MRKNHKEAINKYGGGDMLPGLHKVTFFCLLCIAEIWSKQNCIPKEKKTAQIIRKTCSNYDSKQISQWFEYLLLVRRT